MIYIDVTFCSSFLLAFEPVSVEVMNLIKRYHNCTFMYYGDIAIGVPEGNMDVHGVTC